MAKIYKCLDLKLQKFAKYKIFNQTVRLKIIIIKLLQRNLEN